ncbi:unnamed protein product, partial [Strongylus vulgaris]
MCPDFILKTTTRVHCTHNTFSLFIIKTNVNLCEQPKIELGERPVPVSFAKHKVETLSSERIAEQEEFMDSTMMPSPRMPSRQETQRPRIVGPPIRRPKPKPKGNSGTPGSYKTTTGNGACPPGNEPTRDDDGRLILCNGLEPNFFTILLNLTNYRLVRQAGILGSTSLSEALFSAQNSAHTLIIRYQLRGLTLRKLKYGETCDPASDTCTQGSTCIDNVCKCGPGYALSPNGWCERFEFNMGGKVPQSFHGNFAQTTQTSTTQQSVIIETIPDAIRTTYETTPAQIPSRRPFIGPKVIRHRFLGTRCRDNDVCINGGECRDDATPFAAPGQSCAHGEDCSGGSFCADGICQCD